MVSNVSGKRVLVASSMNAGAEVTSPVAKALKERGALVHVVSYGAATNVFKQFGLPPDSIIEKSGSNRDEISTHLNSEVRRILGEFNPDVVLTGTQLQDSDHRITLEQILWFSGRRSVAVTDTWINYNERFSDLVPGSNRQIVSGTTRKYLPTVITAIDQFAFDQMVALGFDPSTLAVTGNPYFEYVLTVGAGFSDSDKQALVEKPVFSSFTKDAKLVVFLSDSIETAYQDIGFTEKSVLASFIQGVVSLDCPVNVVVRPHPFRGANAKDAFDSSVPSISKAKFVLHNPASARGSDPANDYPIELLLAAADVVVGTINNPLITAAVLRANGNSPAVIQYTPELSDAKYRFYAFLADRGITSEVLCESDLAPMLNDALSGSLRQANFAPSAGAIDRIIDLL